MKDTGGSLKKQYYATFVLNLVTLVTGIGIGWASPILPKLQSNESPISIDALDDKAVSCIVSNFNIGYLIGVAIFAILADKIGRKNSMYLPAIILIVGWLLTIFPQNVYYLYVSRIFIGIAAASIFITLPIYVSEFSDERVRGMLTSCMMIVSNFGILLAFVLGSYSDYYYIGYISIAACVLFLLLLIALPESPNFLLSQNKLRDAEKSFCYYNGIQMGDIKATEKFINPHPDNLVTKDDHNLKVTWKDFTKKSALKASLISFVTCMLMHLCGGFVLMSYAERTFREAGSSLSPEMSSIIVSVVQLIGAYISTSLVDRAGRKILLSLSSLTTGLFLIILGVFVYCKNANIEVSQYNWIPVLSFSGAIFCASWGIYPIPFVIMSEMLPIKLRAVIMSSCTFAMGLLGVLLMKFYLDLVNIIGLHSCLFIFAFCCIFQCVFVLLLVPETKGKTVEAILRILEGDK